MKFHLNIEKLTCNRQHTPDFLRDEIVRVRNIVFSASKHPNQSTLHHQNNQSKMEDNRKRKREDCNDYDDAGDNIESAKKRRSTKLFAEHEAFNIILKDTEQALAGRSWLVLMILMTAVFETMMMT